LQGVVKSRGVLEKEVKSIEEEIWRCKLKIMMAFNYAGEKGQEMMVKMQ